MDVPVLVIGPDRLGPSGLSEQAVEEGAALFREHGALRVDGVFELDWLDAIERHYRGRYKLELLGTVWKNRRPLFTVDIEGPFAEASYFANARVFPLIQRLLGKDCILGACSSVVSFPGAPQQYLHRDSESLFGDYALDIRLPPYALTMLVPLVDANQETGSTRVWPGTHRVASFEEACGYPSEAKDVPRGSVLMTDSRVVHCGEPNRSDWIRPLLYNAYHRRWFRDQGGYRDRPPVGLSALQQSRLPSEYRHMFRIAEESSWLERSRWNLKRSAARLVPLPVQRTLRRVLYKTAGEDA